jgi:hypothetical protein
MKLVAVCKNPLCLGVSVYILSGRDEAGEMESGALWIEAGRNICTLCKEKMRVCIGWAGKMEYHRKTKGLIQIRKVIQ